MKTANIDIAEINLIHFYNAIPEPLAGTHTGGNVWNRNLVLFKGKNYLLNAESGKGKTTFLNMIFGIRNDYRGELFFNEQNIRNLAEPAFSQLRQRNITYLFQDLRLFPSLTAYENIALAAGFDKTSAEINHWASMLEIDSHLEKPCSRLSLGQQQRVALLRALCQPFEWLLLDEPFSHIDKRISAVAMQLIVERAQQQSASVIATSLGDATFFESFERLYL